MNLLDEFCNHSTFMGNIWLTLLIGGRIVLTIWRMSVYGDEQSHFMCNTEEPVCTMVCYDAFMPVSHIRFCVFQVIMITTPSIMYLSFAMRKIALTTGPGDRKRMPIVKKHVGHQALKRDGLMKVYVLQLLSRAVLEVSFLFGQYFLYGLEVVSRYPCSLSPCLLTTDCFVSGSAEKTIFLHTMYAISSLCLLFTVLEILHLCNCFCAPRSKPPTPRHPALSSQNPDLKLTQQHLDLAYQTEDNSLSHRISPESNGTAVKLDRFNFAQEKQSNM